MDIRRRYRIVIALDHSQYSEIVLEHGLDQAARHDDPDLHVLTVIENADDVATTKTWLAASVLEGLESFRAGRPDWRTRLHIGSGDPAAEITSLAAEIDADLIVIGRYGLHHPRRSTADLVVAAATCSTLVVGLTGRTIGIDEQCSECVAVREHSDGERWFCAAHSAPDRPLHLTTLVSSVAPLTHAPLW